MGRIRSIKPEFFFDEELAELPAQTRLFFIGLWNQADRRGRLEDQPGKLRAQILPYEKVDAESMLASLHPKFITRYTIGNHAYIQINAFEKHQRPHHTEVESEIPSAEGFLTILGPVPTPSIRKRVYERDHYKCVYCARDLAKEPRLICLDHVVPLSKRGSNFETNLATSCKKCNAVKLDRTPEEVGFNCPSGLGHMVVDTPLTGGEAPVISAAQGGFKGEGKGKEKGKENSVEEASTLVGSVEPTPDNGLPTPERVKDAFNRLCAPILPTVRWLTAPRKQHIKARCASLDQMLKWEGLFARVARTPFLLGENDKGWKASFDWLVANDARWTRIMEGVYDGKG